MSFIVLLSSEYLVRKSENNTVHKYESYEIDHSSYRQNWIVKWKSLFSYQVKSLQVYIPHSRQRKVQT